MLYLYTFTIELFMFTWNALHVNSAKDLMAETAELSVKSELRILKLNITEYYLQGEQNLFNSFKYNHLIFDLFFLKQKLINCCIAYTQVT